MKTDGSVDLQDMKLCRRTASVDLQDMKFCAAHFVAFQGFREPLHGHNYSVGVRVEGLRLQADGYLVDFGDLKSAVRAACKRLDHRTLIPTRSEVLQLEHGSPQVLVKCEDGASFSFPADDCVLIPVINTTTEELAEYLWTEIVIHSKLRDLLVQRGVEWLEVTVSERPGQHASFRHRLQLELAESEESVEESVKVSLQQRLPQPCLVSSTVAASEHASDAAATLAPVLDDRAATTPSSSGYMDPRAEAEAAYRRLIECLGEQEASRPELLKTPARAAKAWLELTEGIQVEDPLTAVGEGIFEVEGAQDLVAVRDMPFNSLCEHHLLPFWGSVSVAYIPNGRVLGLSKFARLLKVLARRLQLQERLAQQFAEALDKILAPQGVAIAIEARHSCMAMRGVATPAVTRTVALRGVMKDDPSIRALLLSGVSSSDQVAKL